MSAESLRRKIDKALREPIDLEKLAFRLIVSGMVLVLFVAASFGAWAALTYAAWPVKLLVGLAAGCFVTGLVCLLWTFWTRF